MLVEAELRLRQCALAVLGDLGADVAQLTRATMADIGA